MVTGMQRNGMGLLSVWDRATGLIEQIFDTPGCFVNYPTKAPDLL